MKKIWLALVAIVPLVGACSSAGPTNPLRPKLLSDAEYLQVSDETRKADDDLLDERVAILHPRWRKHYLAGLAVPLGDPDFGTGLTLQREPITGLAAIYPGYDPDGMDGAISEGMYVTFTDPDGNILFNRGPGGQVAPIVALANVATQHDVGRDIINGAFGIVSSAANNSGAAIISKRVKGVGDSCEGCGPDAVVINNPAAVAAANAQSAATMAIYEGIIKGPGRPPKGM